MRADGRLRRHSRMPIRMSARYTANKSMVRYSRRVKYRYRLAESIRSHQCQFSYTLRATRKVANTLAQVTMESTKGHAAGVYRRRKHEITADSAMTPANPQPLRAAGQRLTVSRAPSLRAGHC